MGLNAKEEDLTVRDKSTVINYNVDFFQWIRVCAHMFLSRKILPGKKVEARPDRQITEGTRHLGAQKLRKSKRQSKLVVPAREKLSIS